MTYEEAKVEFLRLDGFYMPYHVMKSTLCHWCKDDKITEYTYYRLMGALAEYHERKGE